MGCLAGLTPAWPYPLGECEGVGGVGGGLDGMALGAAEGMEGQRRAWRGSGRHGGAAEPVGDK